MFIRFEIAEYTRDGKRKRPSYVLLTKWAKSIFNAALIDTVINGFDKALMMDPNVGVLNSSFMSFDTNYN